jgi:hypothetical protein
MEKKGYELTWLDGTEDFDNLARQIVDETAAYS